MNPAAGLAPPAALALTGAQGAAVVSDMDVKLVGETPSEREVRSLAGRIGPRIEDGIYVTDSLAADVPEALEFKDTASGLLAVSISQIHPSYVLWFRPEVIRTVSWAGEPTKARDPVTERLSPRKSFETWKETVQLTAMPWSPPTPPMPRSFAPTRETI